jgi:hypothetical protein
MRQPYVLVTLMLLLMGCTNGVEKVKLIPGEKIVFDLPFEPTLIPIGYCDRGDTQNSFYYFADFRTSGQIACCNIKGDVITIINLKPWIKDNDPWHFMQVRSMDSIVAISSNYNELFFFNRQHIIHRQLISPILYKNLSYTIYSGPQPPDQGFNIAFSCIELDPNDFSDPSTGRTNKDSFHAALYRGPALAKYTNLFSDSVQISLIFAGHQARFMPNRANSKLPLYLNSDTKVYYVSCYSDTLYEFDINSGLLSKQVPLVSKYSDIGARPGIFTENFDSQAHSDSIRDIKGIVQNGKYDRYRKLIYLMLYHEVPGDSKPIEKGEHRAWSLFIYNEQLEKLAEIPFKADTYLPKGLIVNPEGILLKKIDKDMQEHTYQQTFQQFNIVL